jgi:hypothetical protein
VPRSQAQPWLDTMKSTAKPGRTLSLRCVVYCLSLWLLTLTARADDVLARELFDAGVKAAAAQNWSEAARLLEASLAQKDRAACRFDLVIAYHELKRPLDVVRHALAFLGATQARAESEESAEVRALIDRALRELAILEVARLPAGVEPRIDDGPPQVGDRNRLYVAPGPHRLELWLGNRLLESIEIELRAASSQPWPRVSPIREVQEPVDHSEVSAAPGDTEARSAAADRTAPTTSDLATSAGTSARPMERLALGLGISGAALATVAVGTYIYAEHRADVLERWPPSRLGYTTASDRYGRSRAAVMPLAFAAGALLASAGALVSQKPRGAFAISLTALLLGVGTASAGAALMIRTPEPLVEGTDIPRPTREAASLLLAASAPLLSVGVRLQWNRWHR